MGFGVVVRYGETCSLVVLGKTLFVLRVLEIGVWREGMGEGKESLLWCMGGIFLVNYLEIDCSR